MAGRSQEDLKSKFSWTKWVNYCGYFVVELFWTLSLIVIKSGTKDSFSNPEVLAVIAKFR